MDAGAQTLESSEAHNQGAVSEVEQPPLKLPTLHVGFYRWQFTHYTTAPVPKILLLIWHLVAGIKSV